MQNKIDRVNERLNEFFKDNCSACTHNTYNIENEGYCELEECNFEMNGYTKNLINDINDILYKDIPLRCNAFKVDKYCKDCKLLGIK